MQFEEPLFNIHLNVDYPFNLTGILYFPKMNKDMQIQKDKIRIGKQPLIGNFQICDSINTVNGQAAYTLQVGGVNVSPETVNNMIVSVNGVIQKPTASYTVAGSTITFTSNLVTGDVIDFIQILGSCFGLGNTKRCYSYYS